MLDFKQDIRNETEILNFAPLTYFIYPFVSGLWVVFLISLEGYGLSTIVGKLPLIEH